MHAYTVTEDTSTDRRVRFERLETFTHPDGYVVAVRSAHWEARDDGFPTRLWLRDRHGDLSLLDPANTLPEWLAATAPDWADR